MKEEKMKLPLLCVAVSIALLLGGCGNRQDEARNTPAEITAAAVEAHVKTMVEGLGDVRIVETSPGRLTGTGSHDGRVYQFISIRGSHPQNPHSMPKKLS